MGGLFGHKATISTKDQQIAAIQLQTSSFGLPIRLLWGRVKVSVNMLWYGAFTAIPHTTTQSSGGKGGSGVSQQNTTYTYSASMMLGLCEGPIANVGRIWRGKQVSNAASLGFSVFTGSYSQSPWGYLTTNFPGQDLARRGQASLAIANYDLGGSAAIDNHLVEVNGPLQVGIGSAKTFTVSLASAKTIVGWVTNTFFNHWIYLVSVAHGFSDGLAVVFPSSAPSVFDVGVVYYIYPRDVNSFFLRAYPGGPRISAGSNGGASGSWSLQPVGTTLTCTAHGFSEKASVRLTTTGALPAGLTLSTDYIVHVVTANSLSIARVGGSTANIWSTGSGTNSVAQYSADANPKDIIVDFLTNQYYGAAPMFPLGSLTQFSNYCVANGIFFSPVAETQREAARYIDDWVKAANSQVFFSEGVLKIVPYGDKSVTGNGVTFTPDLTPVYSLTDDDFLADHADPVEVTRSTPADAFNILPIEFLNRANDYNVETTDARDQANIELYGARPAPTIVAHAICDPIVARIVTQLLLQRALYMRNTHRFRLGMKYILLEPMDLLTITDPVIGTMTVRILEISESDTNELDIVAEEHLGEVNSHALYASDTGIGFSSNYNEAPGSVNTPFIFDAPGVLTVSGFEVWAGLSGGPNWGGAFIWVSTDNIEFKQQSIVNGAARVGFASASFPAGIDPDRTNMLSVDLSSSRGALTGGALADADQFNTLSIIDGELIAFQDATLITQYNYTIGTYIRRGVYNSPIGAHDIGSIFARLDQAIAHIEYDPAFVGRSLSLKFQSFNLYGAAIEDISTLTSYTFTPAGSISFPDSVTGFSATQNDIVVLFQWDLLDPLLQPNIDGYEIRRNPVGLTSWADGEPVTQTTRGTQITTVKVPPGDWTFLICARDHSGNYSRTPTRKDLVVVNSQAIVLQVPQEPLWLGLITSDTSQIADGWPWIDDDEGELAYAFE